MSAPMTADHDMESVYGNRFSASPDTFPYNIYAGTNTGFLKGCMLSNRTCVNINSVKDPDKNNEITSMCWWRDENSILTGCRDGRILNYSLKDGSISSLCTKIPDDKSVLRVVKSYKGSVFTAFSSGVVNCDQLIQLEDDSANQDKSISSRSINICAGDNLFCMDHNQSFENLISTGGKENPLKIWDLTSSTQPIFTAKNVKNDWLNLRVPVWEMKAEFIPQSKKIVTGTGYSQIRLYDMSSSKRRPVLDIKLKDSREPISALAIRPHTDSQVVVGTTIGTISLVDLRKMAAIKQFKGAAGGITDIKFHETHPVFAACGVDRFIRCYNADLSKRKCSSIYIHSQVNSLLFSSEWNIDYNEEFGIETTGTKKAHSKGSKIFSETNDDEKSLSDDDKDDALWDAMEVVQTKKRKKVPLTSHAKSSKKLKKKSKA
ncbi:WD repeat-containing protein 74-like [Physella acuta]|uniref:WD repeat-containing protein 74-like n=1 Tax=Physella acuta TaxID=109671 RepID=UPI0027DC7659|nr:WD repeat-containing protein 74-like [Physella acuta]